jgi:hypothetical protein
MTLELGDRELFVLAEFLNRDGSESGTDMLFEYWTDRDRFMHTKKLFGTVPKIDSLNEIQYVFATEHICEKVYISMKKFITGPVCGPGSPTGEFAPEVITSGRELISRMESFRTLSPRRGWESFFKRLSECAVGLIRELNSLTYMNAGGTYVHISTNTDADHVFSVKTEYHERSGTYFVFEG